MKPNGANFFYFSKKLQKEQLDSRARKMTDSKWLQTEACILDVPCTTLQENTEWVDTEEAGWNVLVGAEYELILESIANIQGNFTPAAIFRDVMPVQGSVKY